MNKKIKLYLIACGFMIMTSLINAQNPFCGGYVGANFNFGILTFPGKYTILSEESTSGPVITPIGAVTFLNVTDIEHNFCNHNSFTPIIGGGITLGYNWSNPCFLYGLEFNGFFYGNPSKATIEKSITTVQSRIISEIGEFSIPTIEATARHLYSFSSNIRLDGILKLGLMSNQCAAIYILGGASGINLKRKVMHIIKQNSDPSTKSLNTEVNCCFPKWIAGGTIGTGIRAALNNCLDFVVEFRYSKYQNICFCCGTLPETENSKKAFGPDPVPYVENRHPASYLGLIGLNWNF